MPMKLFVITAGALGTPLAEFLGVVILARIIRYFGEVWLGVVLGHESSRFLKTHVWQFTASAVGLFAVLYGLMVWRHRAANSVPTR
jgi:membrane protein DedA with SNARE-associated domain